MLAEAPRPEITVVPKQPDYAGVARVALTGPESDGATFDALECGQNDVLAPDAGETPDSTKSERTVNDGEEPLSEEALPDTLTGDAQQWVVDKDTQVRLITAAQEGDLDAYFELVQKLNLRGLLYRYAYYRTSNKDFAEDIVQDTLLRAMKYLSTFGDKKIVNGFSRWHVTIARNLLADHFKSWRHNSEVPVGDMLDPNECGLDVAAEFSPETITISALADNAASRVLYAAMDQLGAHQRLCIHLRFMCGLTTQQTASEMDITEGAVKTLQQRAVNNLRRVLRAQGFTRQDSVYS